LLRKVLIANRGEIAVRILRACRSLGLATVAVYSDADRQALHVRLADEAVRLGPAPSARSYLDMDRVLEAARATGADAVHPGYGFLSENAAFARAVEEAGLTFVGPSPAAMERMGDKVRARANAEEAGVPVAPGSPTLRDAEHAREEAKRIGYPILLKASAGGGGIGMRVVRSAREMSGEYASVTKQAAAAFGVPDVFLERFLERPRHIEVQVLADQHGNCLHLYERECSVQRRHQKLVEEAPSPALSAEAREAIGAKAVALARHVGYTNAGTLEFLYEPAEARGPGRFHFNEMNTRLQVEHPVTEMVTGIDIVQWQLRIAGGEELSLRQEDVRLRGHAFEARINAEDATRGFLPSPGPVQRLRFPQGPGIRVDTGLYEGWWVPDAYDSLVAKLVVHADDRDAAVQRMLGALGDLDIHGFTTNQGFHKALFAHPSFQAAELTTRFLEDHGFLQAADATPHTTEQKRRAAALVAALVDAPGGGLAGIRMRQRQPARLVRVPGRRDEA